MKIGNSYLGWKLGNITLSTNKSFEYQFEFLKDAINFTKDTPFEFRLRFNRKTDHAGVCFTFGIFYIFWVNLKFYDHRHWNYDEDRWALPGDNLEDE